MGMSVIQYLRHLQALLPRGFAWPRAEGSNLTALLRVLSAELARVDQRAEQLLDEADPRSTSEMLTDWETAVGLPDPCSGQLETVAQRIDVLVTKVNLVGRQSPQFFIDLAAGLGYSITIDEQVDGDPYKWRVNAPSETIRIFTAGSGRAGEPLRSGNNQLLECAINRLCPAHTQVVFGYGG